jgi:hypothetical protein
MPETALLQIQMTGNFDIVEEWFIVTFEEVARLEIKATTILF